MDSQVTPVKKGFDLSHGVSVYSDGHSVARVYGNAVGLGDADTSDRKDGILDPVSGAPVGYGDLTYDVVRSWRIRWIESGATWRFPEDMPLNWDLDEKSKGVASPFEVSAGQ